ncbi:MAG: Lrp/AsnC ligand binding domain-containing protein [Candidatus Bathyarchaeia archaeon]
MVVKAYILVTLTPGSERKVCKKIAENDEVAEISELYGEYDAILKVVVSDLKELDTFITDKVRSLPDVYLTSTMIVAKQYKGSE